MPFDGQLHRTSMRTVLCGLLGAAWAMTAAYGAWHALCYNAEVFLGDSAAVQAGAAVAILALLALPFAMRGWWAPALGAVFAAMARGSDRAWLGGSLLIALALRIGWCLIVPPVQVSDTQVYFDLAARLAAGQPFLIETVYPDWTRITYASWPPGLPLALAPLMALFGPHAFVPLLLNLVLIAVTIVAAFAIARRFADAAAARLVALFLAASPNLVMLSGQASKELLALALLTASVALLWAAPTRAWRVVLSGACQGACLLTQPAFILLPALPALVVALRGRPWRRILRVLLLSAAGAAAVVAPWTIRNAVVLGEFVPVSTGGGSILYRANHDLANGGYLGLGEDLPYERLSETEQDRRLNREAMQWIREHPAHFAYLVHLKHRLYLGDDSSGPYSSLRRSNDIGDARYVLAKGVTNAIWLAELLLLALIVAGMVRDGRFGTSAFAIHLGLVWMYLLSVHTLAESGSRHHLALSALIVVFVVAGLRRVAAPAPEARGGFVLHGGRLSVG